MRIAPYVRVSTDEQVQEGYSIEAQKDRLLNYCKSQDDWEIVEWYIEEGESAKDLNRPQLKRLLEDSEKGLFDVVLVYRLDRLTRSVMDLYKLLELFEKSSVKFKSATELYDTTTAMGKLFITLVAALAQWERENLSERVRFGMEQLVREGKWPGGPTPFGFNWDGETMTLIPDEVHVLRELRRVYMSGEGLRSTTRLLNATGHTRNGKNWTVQTVLAALDNPIYAGKIRYGSKKKNGKYASSKKEDLVEVIWSDTAYPTIFTWEEYEEHTAKMKRVQFYGHSKKREYWFGGVIRCARCGATMIGRPYKNPNSSPEVNYICSNRSQNQGCNMPLLRQSLAERIIMGHIEDIRLTHELIAAASEDIKTAATEIHLELAEHEKQLRQLKERRRKWQYMLAEDLMSESDFKERKREEDEKERYFLEQIDNLRIQDVGMNPAHKDLIFELPAVWAALDDGVRKEAMQTIFKSVVFECKQETGKGAKKGTFLDFYITEANFN